MDKKVELQVLNITNSQAQVGAFAMLLGEVDGERQLPIICLLYTSRNTGNRKFHFLTGGHNQISELVNHHYDICLLYTSRCV